MTTTTASVKICRTCGFTDCPGATTGNCPRWPASDTRHAPAQGKLTGSLFADANLSIGEYIHLTRKLVSGLRACADECGALRRSSHIEGLDWRWWDEAAADIEDVLTDDLVSVAL